jgi:hypothetical protein
MSYLQRMGRLVTLVALTLPVAFAPTGCGSDSGGGPSGTGGAGGASGGSSGTGGRSGGGAGGSSTGGASGTGGATAGSGGASGGQGGAGTGGASGGAGGGGQGGSAGGGSGGSGATDADPGAGDAPGAATDAGDTSGPVSGTDAATPEGCTLKWSPSAVVEGNKAFEFLELPDRNMIHPGADHLSVVTEGDIYRFDSHYEQGGPIDYDRMLFTGPMRNDRLRGEVRGMVGPGGILEMKNGQTWRIHWALNIPTTLKGTGRFTHIFQLKFIDTGGGLSGSPILTLSLSSPDNIQMRLWLGGPSFPVINLGPLHDRWLSSELVIKVGPGNSGTVRWIFKDGTRTLHDSMVSGTTWPGNAVRVWPKWGIYRGITDGVRTTHMLTREFRAYQCQ